MKISVLLFSFSALITALPGDIRETPHFSSVLEHAEKGVPEETLVICDIDNTLLKAAQYLGSVAWSEEVLVGLKARGIPDKEAAKIESLVWQNVQPHVEVALVDPKAAQILHKLQEKKIGVVCLTVRTPEEADYSLKQLRSLDIDLQGFFLKDIQYLPLEAQAMYREGVLFSTPFNKKSQVLLAFLEKNQLRPKCIIFIDDKLSHVQDIVLAVEQRGISCVGLWFTQSL
jgi:predicted phosphatase